MRAVLAVVALGMPVWSADLTREGTPCDHASSFLDVDDLIRRHVGDRLGASRRPQYVNPLRRSGAAEAEVGTKIV